MEHDDSLEAVMSLLNQYKDEPNLVFKINLIISEKSSLESSLQYIFI